MTNQAGTGSCSYCSAPITWVEPLALWKSDPDAFSDVLSRAGLEYRQVESVWFCTECTNFALIGDGFDQRQRFVIQRPCFIELRTGFHDFRQGQHHLGANRRCAG